MVIDPAKPFDLTYRVDEMYHGGRLDRYVNAMVPTISRTRVQRYNATGRILVNGTPRADHWRVQAGDEVVLKCNIPKDVDVEMARHIPVEVLYEDDVLLAVNKQPGLVVHPVALHRHDTLMNALYWKYKDRLPPGRELSLVNRIDKLTSGIVLVTKAIEAKREMQRQFEARTPHKTYLALACGWLAEEQGEIDLPIGPKENCRNRCVMDIRRDSAGKPSNTQYWLRERLAAPLADAGGPGPATSGRFSLVRLALRTGRQHQIRVHLRALGHPLAGDHLYHDNRGLRWTDPAGAVQTLSRFALHSESLTIVHPVTGKDLHIEAPLPPDMAGLLDALRSGIRLERFLLFADHEEDYRPPPKGADEEQWGRQQVPPGQHRFDRL